MKLQLLLTGNELMAGDTIDTNSAMIAGQLSPLGIGIHRKVTVGDDTGLLDCEIRQCCDSDCDVLIVNGGLGPTVDDLTAEVLAGVMGVPVALHPHAMQHLEAWCGKRGFAVNDANRKQAMLPKGCSIVANATGSAVGFRAEVNGTLVICTPGVPSELRIMMDKEIMPLLLAQFPAITPRHTTRLRLFGIGESTIQQAIDNEFPDWPEEIELGFRANLPLVELKLTSHRAEDEELKSNWERKLRAQFGDYIIGTNEQTMPGVIVEQLAQAGKTLTLAESCTGGLIASQITSIAGASRVFEAGYVTYSNAIKASALGVPKSLLEAHGAVSEAVVLAMAAGALAASGADLAIAVSGIAGPDGGSDDKPVGTVWLAWGSKGQLQARQLYFPTGRAIFQELVCATALDLVRRELAGIPQEPRYFRDRQLRR